MTTDAQLVRRVSALEERAGDQLITDEDRSRVVARVANKQPLTDGDVELIHRVRHLCGGNDSCCVSIHSDGQRIVVKELLGVPWEAL
jgi:hypothetical protein